jgi:AcrR family transcriptional regulator
VTAANNLAIKGRPPRTVMSGEASPHRRPLGRPPGGILSAEKITAAAFTLINECGYQGLTMAALARGLNVSKSALYNHVTCKQDVLRLLEEHLISQVNISCFRNSHWEEAIQSWALSYRDVFAKHTPLVPIIAILPVTDAPKTLAMYEEVSTWLLKAGFPEDHIIPIIAALEAFISAQPSTSTRPKEYSNPVAWPITPQTSQPRKLTTPPAGAPSGLPTPLSGSASEPLPGG